MYVCMYELYMYGGGGSTAFVYRYGGPGRVIGRNNPRIIAEVVSSSSAPLFLNRTAQAIGACVWSAVIIIQPPANPCVRPALQIVCVHHWRSFPVVIGINGRHEMVLAGQNGGIPGAVRQSERQNSARL